MKLHSVDPEITHIDKKSTARRLGVTVALPNKWLRTGNGPAYSHFGRLVRYRISDVDAWADAQRTPR